MFSTMSFLIWLAQEAADKSDGNLGREGIFAAVASVATALFIKMLDIFSARAKSNMDDASAIRAELRQTERDLRDRLDRTERRIERYRARCIALETEVAAYTAHCAYLTGELHKAGISVAVKMPTSRMMDFDDDVESDDDDDKHRRRGQ